MKFECTHCDQKIDAPEELAGTEAKCPNCGGTIDIPDAPSRESSEDRLAPKSSKSQSVDQSTIQNNQDKSLSSQDRAGVVKYRFGILVAGALSLLCALGILASAKSAIHEILAALFGIMFLMCLCTLAILEGLNNLAERPPEGGAAEDQPFLGKQPPEWVEREQDRE